MPFLHPGEALFPGPPSVEMDLGTQWGVDVCEQEEREDIRQSLWGTRRRSSSWGCLLSPHALAPSPTSARTDTPHPQPRTGSLCGPDLPSSSGKLLNKQTFLYGAVGLLETRKTQQRRDGRPNRKRGLLPTAGGFGSTGHASRGPPLEPGLSISRNPQKAGAETGDRESWTGFRVGMRHRGG